MLNKNDVPILNDCHQVYIHYTTTAVKDSSKIRVRCELRRMGDEKTTLTRVSFLCAAETDISKEVPQRTPALIKRKLAQENNNKLLNELFPEEHPFGTFCAMHFLTIAHLHGWAASTIHQYQEHTLKLIIPRIPNKPLSALTALDFDNAITEQCEKNMQGGYSKERVGQYFDVLYSVMEFATASLGLPCNVLQQSRYYDSSTAPTRMEPLNTLITRHLKTKGLGIQEQTAIAEELDQKIRDHSDKLEIGTAIQMMTGARPSEVCALTWSAIRHFTTPGWEDRCYMLIAGKVDSETEQVSYRMKTLYGYRAIPIHHTLQMWLDEQRNWVKESLCISDEELKERFIVAKDKTFMHPIKSQKLCKCSKEILNRHVADSAFTNIEIPVSMNDDGVLIGVEKNRNAYQFRRNFAHMLLNILGLSFTAVQGVFGHKLSDGSIRRWLLYHEGTLVEQLKQLDQIVLLPEKPDVPAGTLGRRKDPREEVRMADGIGSFDNVPALKLAMQPYSNTDRVSVQLFITANEPGDVLTASVHADSNTDVSLDSYYFDCQEFGPAVNLQNDYLDYVFGVKTTEAFDGCDYRHSEIVKTPERSTFGNEGEDDAEDREEDDDTVFCAAEDIDEFLDANGEFEEETSDDEDNEIDKD